MDSEPGTATIEVPRADGGATLGPYWRPGLAQLFWILFVIGSVGRTVACIYTCCGLAHPDEHQQYLEQSIRCAYGYGVTFWEQDRGMRHTLFPRLLALGVLVLDATGFNNPFLQATVLRLILSILSFLVMTLIAWRWFQQGRRTAALFLMLVMTAAVDLYYIQGRILSETAMAVPLLWALYWERRRPLCAGLCLALVFALRFQAGVILIPSLAAAALLTRSRISERLLIGLFSGLVLVGGWDWIEYGRWFHTSREYVQACIIENKAACFGTHPVYFYLLYGFRGLIRASVLAPLLLIAAWRSNPRLSWTLFLFVLGNSFVGHKEVRFLWSMVPLVAILLAEGLERLCHLFRERARLWILLSVLSFLIPSVIRIPLMNWQDEPYHSSCVALARLAQRPDTRGVAVIGVPRFLCGNYFYFRRPLPLLVYPLDGYPPGYWSKDTSGAKTDPSCLLYQPEFLAGHINYLVVTAQYRPKVMSLEVEEVEQIGEVTVYRVYPASRNDHLSE